MMLCRIFIPHFSFKINVKKDFLISDIAVSCAVCCLLLRKPISIMSSFLPSPCTIIEF